MTRFFLFVFFVTLFAACKPGIPKDVIPPEEMEHILYDIHIIDGYVGAIPTPDSAKKVSAPLYKGIFKKYGVDSALHAKSMSYYYKRPDLLSKMYDKISERIGKEREAETKRQDKQAQLEIKKAEKLAKIAAKKRADTLKKENQIKQADTSKKIAKPVKTSLKSDQPVRI